MNAEVTTLDGYGPCSLLSDALPGYYVYQSADGAVIFIGPDGKTHPVEGVKCARGQSVTLTLARAPRREGGEYSAYIETIDDPSEKILQHFDVPSEWLLNPVEGFWYWVTEDGDHWWPAKRRKSAVGGWTNDDTWEDFDLIVNRWQLIEPPKPDISPTKSTPPAALAS